MSPEYRALLHYLDYNQAMLALTRATLANHPDQHIWHAFCVGLTSKPEIKRLDSRDPDYSRQGIFIYHNCYMCNSGEKPCVNRNPNRCDYPLAKND